MRNGVFDENPVQEQLKTQFFTKITNIDEYPKSFSIIQCKTNYLMKLLNKTSKKIHRTSKKYKILFLEHPVLEPSRQHQLSQYVYQIEVYKVSCPFGLRVCRSVDGIHRNRVFIQTQEGSRRAKNGVLMNIHE